MTWLSPVQLWSLLRDNLDTVLLGSFLVVCVLQLAMKDERRPEVLKNHPLTMIGLGAVLLGDVLRHRFHYSGLGYGLNVLGFVLLFVSIGRRIGPKGIPKQEYDRIDDPTVWPPSIKPPK